MSATIELSFRSTTDSDAATQTAGGAGRRELDQLPPEFLGYLEQEEEQLDAMLESLAEVRTALLKNDLEALSTALERQAEAVHQTERVRARRGIVLRGMADRLHVDADGMTLRKVAESLPTETASWLEESRSRLREKAQEVERLNRANAAMVFQAVDVTRQVLSELTSSGPAPEVYNASGSLQGQVGGSTFEVGG